MVLKNDVNNILTLIGYLVLAIVLFVPINYTIIALHEWGHAAGAVLTGGYATEIVLYPSLFTGGGTYCGGGIQEVAWCAGMFLTSLLGFICAYKGGWLGRYVGLICGVRLYVGFIKLYLYGSGWCDTSALLQLGTPLAYALLIITSVLGIASVATAVFGPELFRKKAD